MAIDRTAPEELDPARWRHSQEIRALHDTVTTYRKGAASLAADVAALRAEAERLREALRHSRRLRGGRLIEVEIELDQHAQDLVGAILAGELADLPAQQLEDAQLLARELTVGSVRRSAPATRAMLRVELSAMSLRVELHALGSDPDPAGLSIVERLSERWGCEQDSAGSTRVWAQLPSA